MTCFLGLDTETTPFEEGRSIELKLWCVKGEIYKVSRKINKATNRLKKCIELENFQRHGYDTESFENFLESVIQNVRETRENHVISAFNLPFDFYALMPDLSRLEHVFTDGITENTFDNPSFIIIPVIIAKRKNGKLDTKKLYIVDLANYTGKQWNLKKIAKSFDLPPKLHEELGIDFNELPRDYEVTSDMIEYCYRDAEIVFMALKKINPTQYGRMKLSASSLAFTDLKNRSGWKYFDRPYWVVHAERESYFGGRTEVNQMFRGYWIDAVKYDVHSMYPSVMYDMKVPTEFLGKLTRKNGGYTDLTVFDLLAYIYNSDDLQAIVKCDLRILKDCLPYRTENKELSFTATGEYQSGTWTLEELYPAIRDLEVKIEKVSAVFLYKAEKGLFNGFVNYWYNVKKHTNDPLEYFMSKLMLNGAYGKFGQRQIIEIDLNRELGLDEIKVIEEDMSDKNFYEWISENKDGELKSYKLRKIGNIIRSSVKTNDESPFKCSIIASIVTARARRKLWEVMRKIDWCYTDTDSITIPHYVLAHTPIGEIIEVHKSKLGTWDIEKCCDKDCQKFVFWNKKDYRCLHEFKLKGIPKHLITAWQYDNGEFLEFERIVKPREAQVRSLPPYSKIKGKKKFKR